MLINCLCDRATTTMKSNTSLMSIKTRQPIAGITLKYARLCGPVVPRNEKQSIVGRRQYCLGKPHPRRRRAVDVRGRPNRPHDRYVGGAPDVSHIHVVAGA